MMMMMMMFMIILSPHLPVLAPHNVEAEAASLLVEDDLP